MRTLFTLIILLLYTGSISLVSKQKFGKSVPISFLSIPLILFISQFVFRSFDPGFWIIILFAVLCIPLAIKCREQLNILITPGAMAFIAIFAFVLVLDLGRSFSQWDEFSHWGVMVKEMFRLDKWYVIDESRLLVHKDYPPFLSLFELFWCKISGGFYETVCYRAMHTFLLAMIIPVLADELEDNLKKSDILKYLFLTVMLFCLFRAFDASDVINAIYGDIVISAIFTYGLLVIFLNARQIDLFGTISLCLCSSALLLIKQIGICFVLLLWLYYGLTVFIPCLKTARLKALIAFPTQIIIPVIPFMVWKQYVSRFNISAQFDLAKISLQTIGEVLKDDYITTYNRQLFNNCIRGLFDVNLTLSPLNISIITITFISILMLLWINHSEVGLEKYDTYSVIAVYVVGLVGYFITIAVLFLFCFSRTETETLHNYNRYMASYGVSEFLFVIIIGLILCKKSANNKVHTLLYLACLTIILLSGAGMSALIPGFIEGHHYEDYQYAAAKLDRVIPDNNTVFILSENTIQTQYIMNYYSDKTHTVLCYDNMLDENVSGNYEEQIMQTVFNYDYLYIDDITDDFNQRFRYLNNDTDFEKTRIYKITHTGNGVTAEYVE